MDIIEPAGRQLPENRHPDWPKMCLESWLKAFTRWSKSGQPKELSNKTLKVIRHALECNLLYINELEEESVRRRTVEKGEG